MKTEKPIYFIKKGSLDLKNKKKLKKSGAIVIEFDGTVNDFRSID